jgi:hypothetical protein
MSKEDFDSCNTTSAVRTFGTRYFLYGNRLRCLGGMKLQVNLEGKAIAIQFFYKETLIQYAKIKYQNVKILRKSPTINFSSCAHISRSVLLSQPELSPIM